MNVVTALVAVFVLAVVGYAGGEAQSLRWVFGVALPYAAIATFLAGLAWRVYGWAGAPVPFRITTTCGQQKSLDWIPHSKLESPFTKWEVFARMVLEILLFRSLFRNTKTELRGGPRLIYGEEKWLWLAALAFHWSFLIIFLRHLRFFMEPVPALVVALQNLDGFLQIGAPVLYLSGVIILAALLYLLGRRLLEPQVRYISLFTEFSPVVPPSIGALFFVHLFLLSTLIAYFPFSKLVHMPGIFLSPTRNLANDNRARRHINPWNYPVKVHTYEEWEEEFHDKIVAAGLPLDKE